MPLDRSDVGHRVVVRHRIGARDGRPQYSDVLGELLRFDDRVVVRTADGVEVTVEPADVVAGKRIPPRPTRRAGGRVRNAGKDPGDAEPPRW